MHTLYFHGHPIRTHDRWNYLSMLCAAFTAEEQQFLEIRCAIP